MTTDSVFILFKKTYFNTILACLGAVRCIVGGHRIVVDDMGGRKFIEPNFFVNLGPPISKKMIAPKSSRSMMLNQ